MTSQTLTMTPLQHAERVLNVRYVRTLEEQKRRLIRKDMLAWCIEALAPLGQAPARHHRLLIRELQAIEDGTNDRLMVLMPPGSAKSTYASKLFPAHYLARHPQSLVIGASHVQSLADSFSGDVQRFIRDHERTLGYRLENEAAELWRTTKGGVYRAVGTGGSVTGRRADLIIWDDPLKGRIEADSPTIRANVWAWYRSDLYTRMKPGARVVLVLTRWHHDDPAGRLLSEMQTGGDKWRVLSLPAIAESNDELGRKPGEALWPEWEDLAALDRKRRVLGEREWASLFQQRPTVQEGAIIRRDWWRKHDAPVEKPEMVLMSLDTAYTSKEANDPSACTIWHLTADGHHRSKLLLRYAWRERMEFNELVRHILETAAEKRFCPVGVPLRVLVEAKASGLSVIQELRRRMPSLVVTPVAPLGDKVARAHAVSSLLEGGVVSAMSSDGEFRPFAQMVIDECAAFPQGANDDLVDSTTQALRWFRDGGLEFFAEDAPPLDEPAERRPLY